METFFTSDPHFGHVNMTREGKDLCGRPFETVDEMNKALLEGINSTVTSKQRLVILGDCVMGKYETNKWLLAGIKAAEVVFVPGNHDRWSSAYHHKGSLEERELKREAARLEVEELREGFVALKDWPFRSKWGFKDLVTERGEHPLDVALFSHYPYVGDHTSDDRYADLRAKDEGAPIIHGHVHDSWHVEGRQFNVGVDVNDFKPVGEDLLADWVRSL